MSEMVTDGLRMDVEKDTSCAAGPMRAATAGNGWPEPAIVAPNPSTSAWSTPGEWVRLWLYGFAAYTVLGVLNAASMVGDHMMRGIPVAWHDLLLNRAIEEYTCALFVPPLFWLVHRYPIDRRHWRQNIPLLAGASLLFVVIKYAFVLRPVWALIFSRSYGTLYQALVPNTVPVLFDFWGVIGVAHAVEFYRRAQERERVAAALRVQLSQAQLEALKSQLHPHFLFNTLNSVTTLMHRDVGAADQMVTNLADLLRVTLQHRGAHEISLGEELDLLERYVSIVRVRFRDRLTVSYTIPTELRDALVPHFLLQPLVENALEHGIGQRPGPGRLEISAERVGDELRVSVCDDGPGLSVRGPKGHGVGLANTRARLAEHYGAAQRLTLEPASPTGGARATVVLPLRRRSVVPRVTSWTRPTFEWVSSVA
jgi:two-component system, LytTR family, sensor kinase